MSDKELYDFKNKIIKGLTLSFQRLVAQKKKDDGVLVFSKDGKIVEVRARDL
jgi:hypothetical protein